MRNHNNEAPMSTSAASASPVQDSGADQTQVIRALRDTPLLRDLPDNVMTRIAAISKIVDAPAENEICRQAFACQNKLL